MKYQNLLPSIIIFAIFLLSGIWIGRKLGFVFAAEQLRAAGNQLPAMVNLQYARKAGEYSSEHSNAPLLATAIPLQDLSQTNRPQFKQSNVLLIGVNDLEAPSPTLESIWLLLYIRELPQIVWMPIYPQVAISQDGVRIEANPFLAESLVMEGQPLPSQNLLEILRKEGLWWDHYVIIDQAAIITLIDSTGGIEMVSPDRSSKVGKVNGSEALSRLKSTNGNLQAALFSQANLIQQFCRIPPKSYLNLNRIRSIREQLQNNIVTDITPEHIFEDLQLMLKNGGGFVCEFPSLSLLSAQK